MAQNEAPSPPRQEFQWVDPSTGLPTQYALTMIDELWRQIAAVFGIMPCEATMASNVITLVPILHAEGGRTYGEGMAYTFVAPDSASGDLTVKVVPRGGAALSTIKVMKTGGTVQATTGDLTANHRYLAIYDATADSGAGAMVLFKSA
jgi:hypothetical protein